MPWFPSWAREFAEQYFAGTTCLFVMHGNVHDLTLQEAGKERSYGSITDFLATQLFGNWDVVLRHDLSQGLRIAAGPDAERLRRMVALSSERIGEPKSWPRDPDTILALLDKLIQGILMELDPAKRISVGIILDHAQYLVPTSELSQMAGSLGTRLVRLLSWAQNPYIKRNNIAFCLLCDQLAEINERLIGSAHVATLEVAMPDAAAREEFATWYDSHDGKLGNLTDFAPKQLADLTAGLEPGESRAAAGTGRPVGTEARRPGAQAAQEGIDRAAGARAGRVCRAAVYARRLRGQRRRQAPAGRRRGPAGARAGSTPPRWAISSAGRSAPARPIWPSASPARSAFPASSCATSGPSTWVRPRETWSRS